MSVAASDARELEVVTDVVAVNKTPAFSQRGKVLNLLSPLASTKSYFFIEKLKMTFFFF